MTHSPGAEPVSPGSGYGQPAFWGGLVMGVLSALPIISIGNVCCCLWVVAGGLFSAYQLQQNRTQPISAADGAIVGLLAGFIGTVIQFAIAIPIGLVMGPVEQQMLERLRELAGSNAPPIGPVPGSLGRVVFGIIGFFITLIVASCVSTVSGLVGAAVFAKKPSAPAQPPAPVDRQWEQNEPGSRDF